MCWGRPFSACQRPSCDVQGDRRPGGACGRHLRAVRGADALSGYRRLRALGTRGGWRRRDRRRHSGHAALAHPAGAPSEGLRTPSRNVARRNPRRTQAVWDHFYSLPRVWRRSRVAGTWKGRLAFVLSSKLYRQMYANTGIATDSARRTRSAWSRAGWRVRAVGSLPQPRCRTSKFPPSDHLLTRAERCTTDTPSSRVVATATR